MMHTATFDTSSIREPHEQVELPTQVPVILNGNWNVRIGIVDIFPDLRTQYLNLCFSLFNKYGIKSVTDYEIKPLVKTSYKDLRIITITAFTLNKKKIV